MRILYLGVPTGLLCLARAGHDVIAAVLQPLDVAGRRRVRHAVGRRLPLLLGSPDLADNGVVEALRSTGAEVVLSFYYPRKIPRWLIELGGLGAYGVHPSLLPRWRGPDPCFWTLRAGDTETGVTLHRLVEAYDRGDIIAQRRMAVPPETNAFKLAKRLDTPGLSLLVGCADVLAAGEAFSARPQREALATEAPFPTPEELAIRWDEPVEDILRLVWAAAPEPGAATLLGNTEVAVVKARRARGGPASLRPAEAWIGADGVCVRAHDGFVLLERVVLDDGSCLKGSEVAQLVEAIRSV